MKIIIAGGSGFIGSYLRHFFTQRGDQVFLLTRHPKQSGDIEWDPEKGKLELRSLESDVVINLCGESIFGRWTEKKKALIRASRLIPTHFLCASLLKLSTPPPIYVNASAIGYYGDRGEESLTEKSAVGRGFLAEVCRDWEDIPKMLVQKNIRVILARFGIVLGDGGMLKQVEPPFRMGLGGVIGSGKQYMSWIAVDDLAQALAHCIETKSLAGPINFVAPHPVTNREFTKTAAHLLHRPAIFPVPRGVLFLLFGSGAEAFLASDRVYPERLFESGYHFLYPEIEGPLKKYLRIMS